MTPHPLIRAGLLATSIVVTTLVAGCGTRPADSGAAPPPTPASTSAAAQSGAGHQAAAPAADQPAATEEPAAGTPARTKPKAAVDPECSAVDLKLALAGRGAAAGTGYSALQFTNTSDHRCVMVGFPGVSSVAGDNGQQVGAPAVRSGTIGKQIALAPGQLASVILGTANHANYDESVCLPTQVLRVYAPDGTASMFVEAAGTACSARRCPAVAAGCPCTP